MSETSPELSRCVERLRRFNRFYTPRIGALERNYLGLGRSLTEARLIFELSHRNGCAARDVARELQVDAGYLSRTLKRFEREGIVVRSRASTDHRRVRVRLTAKGRHESDLVNRRSREAMGQVIGKLTPSERRNLVRALDTVQRIVETSLTRDADWPIHSMPETGVPFRP
jgi:DNA-binding MarR family transcriptional regulator